MCLEPAYTLAVLKYEYGHSNYWLFDWVNLALFLEPALELADRRYNHMTCKLKRLIYESCFFLFVFIPIFFYCFKLNAKVILPYPGPWEK